MRFFFIIGISALCMIGCKEENTVNMISSPGKTAESVFLTHDNQGNPVAAWTERNDSTLTFLYATSDDEGASFSKPVSVALHGEIATHAEGMPKVAFKKDGMVVIAYEKKAPTKENKYAGAIYFMTSDNGGKSWSAEDFLHSDTIAGRSRSYFDIESLDDGEVGAAWLDIKLNNETGGRSVRFAKTLPGAGFSNEILVDSSACQCCRIDISCDLSGRINVAYRGLAMGTVGQSIRDMMLASSEDHGQTFSSPLRISADDWAIDGCPHTGPSLCSNKTGLHTFWYTEGNGTGLYYNTRKNEEHAFGQRQLVSVTGRHPQLSAWENFYAMVWEESSEEDDKKFTSIHYRISDGAKEQNEMLSSPKSNAFVPVVTHTGHGFLAAFLMETENGAGVFTVNLKPDAAP